MWGKRWHTHDIHACQLRPYLRKNTNVGAIDVFGREQLPVGDILIARLELGHLTNVAELLCDKWAIRIAFAMHQGEYRVAVLPAVLAC